MNFRSKLSKGYLCSLVLGLGVVVAVTAADDWPTRWKVNGNGETGTLELTIDDEGVVTGQLFGQPVEGWVSGRHLVMRRDAGGGTEMWEGWLSGDGTGSAPIVAGTISVSKNGGSQVYPWFGTLESTAAAPVVVAPAEAPSSAPPVAESPEGSTAVTEPAGGPLAGTWVSLTGERIVIEQDGQRLTVTMPDGSSHSGRVTGDASLVVGLRKGCCNGKLDSPDIIIWSDGVRWDRTD
jgi:hypothetical protein